MLISKKEAWKGMLNELAEVLKRRFSAGEVFMMMSNDPCMLCMIRTLDEYDAMKYLTVSLEESKVMIVRKRENEMK